MLPFIDHIPSIGGQLALYAALFVAGIVLLEKGADKLVDSLAIVAKRFGVSQTTIALLTAGAEWEELAVVTVALAQGHRDLGLGNIVGSCIANVIGSFSLGLLFPGDRVLEVDRSARLYTALLGVVTLVVGALAWTNHLSKPLGAGLMLVFAAYVAVVGYAIYRGVMEPPVDSDSDSESDSGLSSSSDDEEGLNSGPNGVSRVETSSTPLVNGIIPGIGLRRPKSTAYHVATVGVSFIALSVSGYLLAGSSTAFAEAAGLTDTVVGLTLLSFATTLPEKLVAVMAARRGQSGILLANTVGANIMLLTLVLGIVLCTGDVRLSDKTRMYDLSVLMGSSAAFIVVIYTGYLRKWVGGLLLVGYVAYIVGNFVIKDV
ncbi:Sodium/calcium exchanger protein-domain-containing protein [Fimicolochytrium jonesii]|uniref:Sodium/calcium exchanger protein-domain-containing protein n=1 Tax=Fimicolochytrium jonesii TaxID=1396493 RepID=UPI0022FE25F7|nr:Sodium/calcium exchanger protein-domain-containing protein [Fimicolochytrium jonesii]KAI8819307.1 Sodium/calcium exchanger protein-domain-containing protein [Fimicolochytrium jonesii]